MHSAPDLGSADHVAPHPAADSHLTPGQRLRQLLRIERGDIGVIAGYAVAIGLLALATPLAAQVLVNQLTFTALLQPIVIMALLVLLGWGLSGLLRLLQFSVAELLQQRLFVRFAAELALRLSGLSAAARPQAPPLISRFLEIATVQKAASGLLLDAFGIVLQSGLGLLVLAFYHPLLLAFDIALIGCIAFILWGLGRGAIATSVAESKCKYAVVDWLSELAQKPQLFAGAAAAPALGQRSDQLLHSYVVARRQHFRILRRQIGGSLLLQALGSAALLGLGGALVIAGQLTVGQLVAAELIVSGVVASIAKLGKHMESYYDLMAALDKLGYLEDLPTERVDGQPLLQRSGPAALRLSAVTAGYIVDQPILRELTLELEPGAKVAIIGTRGSGKSLLCELLLGLRSAERGLIEIDGQELRLLALPSLRDQVLLLRSVDLLNGSLAENLGLGPAELPLPELRSVLQAVGLWQELADMPASPSHWLHGDVAILSAGQQRRLLVARALLRRPRLLVIDDELALDVDALAPLCHPDAPWTLLLFATPTSPEARLLDRRYFLRDGRLSTEPADPPPPSIPPPPPPAAVQL